MASERVVAKVVPSFRTVEGGGFVVRRPFPVPGLSFVDPFLLLDEMGPVEHGPGQAVGAPAHPHRGFETVTYLLAGSMEHADSAGNAGRLGPGDVQWMTAGDGVVHSELPSKELLREGGRMHGFQLWVNLPKRDKRMRPRYQEVAASNIPVARTEDGLVEVRVIAGASLGVSAVIDTRTPISYLHVKLAPGGRLVQALPAEHEAMVYTFGGAGLVGGKRVADGELAILGAGDEVVLSAPADGATGFELLLLSGVPLREPVARHGPFVMNTREELFEAMEDYQAGRMGRLG